MEEYEAEVFFRIPRLSKTSRREREAKEHKARKEGNGRAFAPTKRLPEGRETEVRMNTGGGWIVVSLDSYIFSGVKRQ